MDRRTFINNSILTAGGIALRGGVGAAGAEHTNPGEKIQIQYIQDKIPTFEIPSYRGTSYEDNVPDTHDLAERSRLAIHGLTAITDPAADYEVYWFAGFTRNPPILAHDFNDWVQMAEGFQEALPLLRIATGDSLNDQVDPVWMQTFLKSIGPDGLAYVPMNGRPWSREKLAVWETSPLWRADGSSTSPGDPSVSQLTTGELCARAIPTLAVYYLRDKNPMWKQAGEQMIQRVKELAIDKGDYAYLTGAWEPHAKIGPNAVMPLGQLAEEMDSRMIQGLAQYYKVTGYEPARELAAKLARFIRYQTRYIDDQGRFLIGEHDADREQVFDPNRPQVGGHAHSHAIQLLCLLEYAAAVDDRDILDFVRTSYDWIKQQGPSFGVSSRVGFFTWRFTKDCPYCESCTVADMVAMAVKLSQAGAGDYWDDADRWLRNHFAEAQMTDPAALHRYVERQPQFPVAWNETAERVAERNVGTFAGWSGTNEFVGRLGIQHCCVGNSSRALYYAWDQMVGYKDGVFRVNLLMNRASRWADVYSYIPYQGRVDVKMKEGCRSVVVRVPEWVEAGNPRLVATVNGTPRSLHWEGRYVNLGPGERGDKLSVTFPMEEQTVKEQIGPTPYTLVIKGSTVVSIEPFGYDWPLYQGREKYRKDEVQWRKVKRFVSNEEIHW